MTAPADPERRADAGQRPPGPDGRGRPPEWRRGPVTLRRGQAGGPTTDQRLLDTHGPTDWVHTDPWRVLRIQAE
ncbi:MAG TPA: TIGR00730 family Rossman fold protein, partial [Frankiaceae bacterium]|nr:TIGR00730 family Rossman fold protein [Frankiaceae bacterium]